MKTKFYKSHKLIFMLLISFILVLPFSNIANADATGQLKVSYIDVGQADSILIQQGSNSMLIDAGNNGDSKTVKDYISNQGISKLDYLVLTHPHEDHIGGADSIIKGIEIGKIYMPEVTSTTKTFKDVIEAIKSKDMQITTPLPGDSFKLGDADCTILSPINSDKDNLNTYSIVIKIVFGNNKFLFTGDAEASNEKDMIDNGYDLSADILKVGHHGSDTSTSDAFLAAVNPKYAVISVGIGNDYGHPTEQTMNKLQINNIPVYRTDECGTITATSDGTNITFDTDAGDYSYSKAEKTESDSNKPTSNNTIVNDSASITDVGTTDGDRIVYYTLGGKSYHYDKNCSTLSRSKTILEGKLSNVLNLGKTDPCDKCVK